MIEAFHVGDPRKDTQPQERLSDEQLGNTIRAVGNNEVKAGMLGSMQRGQIYTKRSLHRRVIEIQDRKLGWNLDARTLFKNISQSIQPGFIEQASDQQNYRYGYIKTSYGEDIGDAAAGNFLTFSSKHPEHALADYIGTLRVTTSDTNGQEQPVRLYITRLQIIRELATTNLPITQHDLVTRLHIDKDQIGEHLQELARKGVIGFEQPQQQNKTIIAYQLGAPLPSEELFGHSSYPGEPTIPQVIYEIFRRDPSRWWTTEDMTTEFLKSVPEQRRATITNVPRLRSTISWRLGQLVKLQLANQGKWSMEVRNQITLTPEQQASMKDFSDMLDGIQSQDPHIAQQGKEHIRYLLSHPEEMSALFAKAKKHSSQANRTSPQTAGFYLESFLLKHSAANMRELQAALAENGIMLGESGMHRLLSKFIAEGALTYSEERGMRKYSLTKS